MKRIIILTIIDLLNQCCVSETQPNFILFKVKNIGKAAHWRGFLTQRKIKFARRSRVSVGLASLIVLSYFQQSSAQTFGYQFKTRQKFVIIPFEQINNLIVIPVEVNGLPLKFILDTGVKHTLLVDRVYGDIMQMNYQRRVQLLGADRNQTMTALVAPNVRIDIGDVRHPNETLLVLEEDFLQFEKIFGTDVQGIIGYEFFRNFIVKIDYARKRIVVYDRQRFKVPKRKYKPVPIQIEFGKPHVNAQLLLLPHNDSIANNDTIHGQFLIDSGASFDLLLDVNADSSLLLPQNTIEGDLGRGLGGILEGKIGKIQQWQVHSFPFDGVTTFFQDNEYFSDLVEMQGRQGIVGAGLLRRFIVIFDYANNVMYLKKSRYFNDPFYVNMSGMVLEDGFFLEDGYIIEQVIPNSPSDEAGILAGDVIISVNGRRGTQLNRTYLRDTFRSRPNKRVKLKIRRGETILSFKFRLRELI